MKVSFDLDGTVYASPNVFRALQHALKAAGHDVGLLTGHGPAEQPTDLARLTSLGFGPWDFLGYTDTVNRVQATILAKVQYLIDHAIDLHFDDVAEPIQAELRARGHHTVTVFKSLP